MCWYRMHFHVTLLVFLEREARYMFGPHRHLADPNFGFLCRRFCLYLFDKLVLTSNAFRGQRDVLGGACTCCARKLVLHRRSLGTVLILHKPVVP